jgi:CDP-diacylglycerol--serine O-phosphatidyltransferase
MMVTKMRRPGRPNMRRAVLLFPSGFTLGNLFFGVFAIIAASRGDFRGAGVWVLWGGICDALDGRVARATNAGSQFGEELDSLVDAITFGLAPGMIMYYAVLNHDGWDWVWVFLFAAAAVLRLARFNIEQAGTAKTYFQGLPSPAAGFTLASYYWFSQSWLYSYGAIDNLPWHVLLRYLMVALAILMVSNVPYPVFPRAGFRSIRSLGASLLVVGALILLATGKLEYFFPLALVYVAWGLVRGVFFSLFERRQPTIPYDLSEGEDEEEDEEDFEEGSSQVHLSRQGHRDVKPVRGERPKATRGRAEAAEPLPRTEERPARAERSERPERPQRTEAERAARREKREKREKREDRPERPRTPRPDRVVEPSAVAAAPVESAVGVDEPVNGAPPDDEVIGRIPGGADVVDTVASTEAAPARKRKRRRRRGERKERGPADANGAPSDSDESYDGGDGGDEGGSDADASPYFSATPQPSSPAPAPALRPPPLPKPSMPERDASPPAAPSSSEPHE